MKIEKVNYEDLFEFKRVPLGEYIYYAISFEHRILEIPDMDQDYLIMLFMTV